MPPVGKVWSTGGAGRSYFGAIVQPAAKSATAAAIKECFSISMSFLGRGSRAVVATIAAVAVAAVAMLRRTLVVADFADHHKEHRDHENCQEGRRQHPADHARTNGVLAR